MFKSVMFYGGWDPKGWEKYFDQLSHETVSGILLLVAEDTPFEYKKIQPLLQQFPGIIFGGIFPEIIYQGKLYKSGIAACTFLSPVSIQVIESLEKFSGTFPGNPISKDTESLFILNDGLANNIPFLIESLYEISNKGVHYFGGGAGSIKNPSQMSLFTKDNFFSGGAIIVSIREVSAIGMGHGWKPVFGPAIANDVDRHQIKSIDWKPAFDFYKSIVEKESGKKITKKNFLDIAKSYPFGLLKYDNEIVLRVPLGVDDDGNIMAGSEVPKNSMLMIMNASADDLIKAAGEAALSARNTFETKYGKSPRTALVIDCITRVMSLEERFIDEMSTINEKVGQDIELFGFLSLGEVASVGDKYIELHNKTAVICMGE